MMRNHPQFRAWLALGAVCFFWGTTYLGIRVALETLPPATLVAIRYLISGSVLLGAAFAIRVHIPKGRELWLTALFGCIILGIGNGALAFTEQWIPSGLAAMFVTTSPFWMVGLEAALPGGQRLHGPTIGGMLVGLMGTLLLVAPGALANGFSGPVWKGFVVLQLGCCAWSFGSILQRRHVTKAHPVVSGAVQQLATGIVYIPVAWLIPHAPVHWTWRGVSAVAYLVVFGSLIGYSAYIYALEHLPVSAVTLYNYVNPVVAVVLGYLFYREKFGLIEVAGMLVIFAGVALVKRYGARAAPEADLVLETLEPATVPPQRSGVDRETR
jgi:drug/metabolite transporter (DMT)-like permease